MTALSGTFSWAYPNVPPTLASQWSQGQANLITKGGVMAFEGDHNMAVDGDAGPMVWTALVNAIATRQADSRPYDYLFANQSQPETLTVWQNGQDVFNTPANTGISDAQTTPGTFAVYERLATQVMKGTNPDGTPYADPVSYVAYFNASEAVHYIDRSSYGSPQSLGCIELPLPAAQTVFGMDYYGTLVTITSG
ncbi:MAG: L,D-transpeptidase [Acidimicrobiales bacterium]